MLKRLRQILFGVEVAFDPAWGDWLASDYAHWATPGLDHDRWRTLTARFVHLTAWESTADLELTERMKVSIAAQASRLLLGVPIDDFPQLGNVLVRGSVGRVRGTRRTRGGTMTDTPQHIAGQAGHDGSIVLVWPTVRRGAKSGRSRTNVVYHEFAHRLDMSDGSTDGTPPLGGHEHGERWGEVMQPAFERVENGESVLRPYAATNPAEFFAVATETFFCRPDELSLEEPEVYAALRAFYRQHPAQPA